MSMELNAYELQLCASQLGYEILPGFSVPLNPDTPPDSEQIRSHLLKQNMLEPVDDTVRLSALGQALIHQLAEPDGWLMIQNHVRQTLRRIYVKGADYLCVDGDEGFLRFLWLPCLDPAIGAYASAMGDWPPVCPDPELPCLTITGICGGSRLVLQGFCRPDGYTVSGTTGEQAVTFKTEADTVNAVTLWLLTGLAAGKGTDHG